MLDDCESRASGAENNYQVCHMCADAGWHFYVNTENGFYYCFKCGGRGRIKPDLKKEVKQKPKLAHMDRAPIWQERELPPFTALSGEAIYYLNSRNFPMDLVPEMGLVEWRDKRRILIPYFNEAGTVIYWNSRTFAGGNPKYLGAPGRKPLYPLTYGIIENLLSKRDAVIVEGFFDAVRVYQAEYNVVALGGKMLPKYLHHDLKKYLNGASHVSIMLDGDDKDALAKSMKLQGQVQQIMGRRCCVGIVCLPAGKDPGSMPPEDIARLLNP
jgi:DNA primase